MNLFSKIAISLSGGGFRASAFHLGVLGYLHSLKLGEENLLQKVRVLSTNSGGTITGLLYAQHVYSDKPFEVFYHKLYKILKEDQLFEAALTNIRTTGSWNSTTKRRNLINAFAEYYHTELFEGATFDIFLKQHNRLETVIFNATEFNHGLPFRFQNNGKFGNRYFDLPLPVKSKIRLGDILAASSCFPGGFEPLKMPDDFGSFPEDQIHKYWKDLQKEPVAIMDGGIVDNQGINSILLEETRSKETISTFIVSDVQQWPGPFEFGADTSSGWMQRWSLRRLFSTIKWSLIMSLLITVIAILSVFFTNNLLLKTGAILILILSVSTLTLSIVASVIKSCIVTPVRKTLDKLVGKKQTSFWQNLDFILELPFTLLWDLLKQRGSSFLKIISDIFMNRISAMQIQEVLFDEKWRGRSLHCNIGFLLEEKKQPIRLSAQLKEMITTAGKMDTSLWFKDEQVKNKMLDKLIICGQVTLNYNLTEYIDQYRTDPKNKITPDEDRLLGDLYIKLHEDWVLFNKDPKWLINQY